MRTATIELEYQNVLAEPPVSKSGLYSKACSNDATTVAHWRDKWLFNIKENLKNLGGDFSSHSVGRLHGLYKYGPAILAGSGPSLMQNAQELLNKGDIPLISCLHNFHYLHDLGAKVDYFVSLDAGEVVLEEISEGGKLSPDEYWEATKDYKLVAFIGSHPELIKKWQGELYVFNAPVPDKSYTEELDSITTFNTFMSSGGNVLGGCLYLAKAIMGAHTSIFIGADFSFGYPVEKEDKLVSRFHSWDSKYDKDMGVCIKVTDIYGNKVKTWPSYYNFKSFFDWVSLNIPGEYINCTEGGCLGAYSEGNIGSFKYLDLAVCLEVFNQFSHTKESCENPQVNYKKILY